MATFLKRRIDQAVTDAADAKVRQTVESILEDVKRRGDAAVRELSTKFDKWSPASFRLSKSDLESIVARVSPSTIADIEFAQAQIRNFAEHQRAALKDVEVETMPGVKLGHRNIPVESVGCYVPGGRYPMVASAHMSIVTARTAGVSRIIACTPPNQGEPHPETIAAMVLGGADEIYVMGGVQAVAAMALGTETIKPVDMLVGPGNAYVAEAKRRVFGTVGIDMIAGPSEIVVVADGSTPADWTAMDLFSQAEHDEVAQSILVCPDAAYVDAVAAAIPRLLADMPRRDIIAASLAGRGALIVARDRDDACEIANRIAPEHLELAVADPAPWAARIRHAGAIFMGRFSSESLGDYCAGPNHVLPTSGTARFSSPLGVYDFQKRSSIIHVSEAGAQTLGRIAATLAYGEGLPAHARSAELRIK